MDKDWKVFWSFDFLEENSEKGYRRKHTENRVARWRFLHWGNLRVLRCFAKRII
jgi:hypothetical protein